MEKENEKILKEAQTRVKEILDLIDKNSFEELEKLLDGQRRNTDEEIKETLFFSSFDFLYKGISASIHQYTCNGEKLSPKLDFEVWYFRDGIEEPVLIGDCYRALDEITGLPQFDNLKIDPQGIQY